MGGINLRSATWDNETTKNGGLLDSGGLPSRLARVAFAAARRNPSIFGFLEIKEEKGYKHLRQGNTLAIFCESQKFDRWNTRTHRYSFESQLTQTPTLIYTL